VSQTVTTDSSDKILTSGQAAKRLGIPLSTLRSLVRYGTLRTISLENGQEGLRESDLQQILKQFEKAEQVELADLQTVDALRSGRTEGLARSGAKSQFSGTPFDRSQEPKRRCQCGSCTPCREAARWERVFQEKFADPDYYARRIPRHSSSLSQL